MKAINKNEKRGSAKFEHLLFFYCLIIKMFRVPYSFA